MFIYFREGSTVQEAVIVVKCFTQKGNIFTFLSSGYHSTWKPLVHPPFSAGLVPAGYRKKDSYGPLFNKPNNRSFHHFSWVFFFFFLFQCYELTVWILEVVILIEQSSNRELSARPDSVESEIVPKLEKYPTERGDGGSGDGGGKITDLCLVRFQKYWVI